MASSPQGNAHCRFLELNNSTQKAFFFFSNYPALGFQLPPLCLCEPTQSAPMPKPRLFTLSVMPRGAQLTPAQFNWRIQSPRGNFHHKTATAPELPRQGRESSITFQEQHQHHWDQQGLWARVCWGSQIHHSAPLLLPSSFLESQKLLWQQRSHREFRRKAESPSLEETLEITWSNNQPQHPLNHIPKKSFDGKPGLA